MYIIIMLVIISLKDKQFIEFMECKGEVDLYKRAKQFTEFTTSRL